MYMVLPYKVKRWLGIASSYSDVFVDRLKGQPYTYGGYDGIDVSKHNGVIKWKEIAKNKCVKFVYIRATHGKGSEEIHKYGITFNTFNAKYLLKSIIIRTFACVIKTFNDMKKYKVKDVLQMLKKDGWYLARTKGDHRQFLIMILK